MARRKYHDPATAPLYTRLQPTTDHACIGTGCVQCLQKRQLEEARGKRPVTSAPAEEEDAGQPVPASLTSAATALRFMLAGKATFTLRSKETSVRYTYKVNLAEKRNVQDADSYFVALLAGPDNTSDFQYLGMLRSRNGKLQFETTRASRLTIDSPPCKGIRWTVAKLVAGVLPSQLEIWHAGRCGRCGRKLTVPESIASGFGPECAGRI